MKRKLSDAMDWTVMGLHYAGDQGLEIEAMAIARRIVDAGLYEPAAAGRLFDLNAGPGPIRSRSVAMIDEAHLWLPKAFGVECSARWAALLVADLSEVEEVESRLAYCAPAVRWMRMAELLGEPDFVGGYLAFVDRLTDRAKYFAMEFPEPQKWIPRLVERAPREEA